MFVIRIYWTTESYLSFDHYLSLMTDEWVFYASPTCTNNIYKHNTRGEYLHYTRLGLCS